MLVSYDFRRALRSEAEVGHDDASISNTILQGTNNPILGLPDTQLPIAVKKANKNFAVGDTSTASIVRYVRALKTQFPTHQSMKVIEKLGC